MTEPSQHLVTRATELAHELRAGQRFDDLISGMVQSQRDGYAMCLNNIGITIDLEETYRTYAKALTNPSDFARGCEAIDWWNRGSIVGWWRHTVVKRLLPRHYSEMRKWQERGRMMKQQAVMIATLSESEEGKALYSEIALTLERGEA